MLCTLGLIVAAGLALFAVYFVWLLVWMFLFSQAFDMDEEDGY